MMIKIIFTFFFGLGSLIPGLAQVGIGTNNPVSTLDVNGVVRISSIPVITSDDIDLSSVTSGSKFRRASTGANLVVENNELITAPVARVMGIKDISAATLWNNLDLEIHEGGKNELATFIRLVGYTSNTDITGIKGGTHGRRIGLYMGGSAGITIAGSDGRSTDINRIRYFNGTSMQLSSLRYVEMVYDALEEGGIGRWIVLKVNL